MRRPYIGCCRFVSCVSRRAFCAIAAIAVIAAFAAPAAAQQAESPAGGALWLVVPFQNATDEPRLYWLGEGSAIILADALQASDVPAISRDDRVRAFDRLRVPRVATLSHATVIRLAQVVGAARVIVGRFDFDEDVLTVHARAIQLDEGRLAPEIVESGSLDDLVGIYARIARRLAPGRSIEPEALMAALPPPQAFEQYVKGILIESASVRMTFLNQALRLHSGYQDVRLALWSVHTELGEHQAALNVVRFVPSTHRLARQAQFLAGVSLLHLGQYQQAFDAFLALHQEAPDASLVNNVGVAQLRRPSPEREASTFFTEAVKADGSDPDLLFNLGYALLREGRPQEAIHWLREVVRRRPADDAAHFILGLALESIGSGAESDREKDLARRLSSRHTAWEAGQDAAPVAQAGGPAVPAGLERVKTEFEVPASLRVDQIIVETAVEGQRQLAAGHLETARRLVEAERDDEAIAELRRAVYLSPYQAEAHLLLGRIYLRTGRTQDALDALTIAVWSDDTAAARLALAEAFVQASDLDAARAELDVVLDRDPEHADARRLRDDIDEPPQ